MMTTAYKPQAITTTLIRKLSKLSPPDRLREVRDKSRRLTIRHQPSGTLALYVELGRGKREKLCDARDIINPSHPLTMGQVEERALILRGESAGGRDFKLERGAATQVPSLNQYLDETLEGSYGWWLNGNRRDGKATLSRLKACFAKPFGKRKLDTITKQLVDTWATRRQRDVIAETVNRDLTALKSALSRAVKWELIPESPLHGHEMLEVDRNKRVERAFTEEEIEALRAAMVAREDRLRKGRESGNQWRAERGYEPKPGLGGEFVDELRAAVELSLRTGMRRRELLSLTWDAVDLKGKNIKLKGETTKSYLTREIPLSAPAVQVLRKWQIQNGRPTKGQVFSVSSFKKSYHRVLTDAGIETETARGKAVWHSLRHTYGTRLGAAGVDVETIRELMGHADVKTTQRYLHTTEDRKRAAVESMPL